MIQTKFHKNNPRVRINGIGKVYLDSGGEVPGIAESKIPKTAERYATSETLQSLTGKEMKINQIAVVYVRPTRRCLKICSPKDGVRIDFRVLPSSCSTFLGYDEMTDLKMVLRCLPPHQAVRLTDETPMKWDYLQKEGTVNIVPRIKEPRRNDRGQVNA